jgi:hypothetical protein
VERNGARQDLVLNLAEIAPEAERLATAPPADDTTQPGGASPPGLPPGIAPDAPDPPGPDAESAR